MTPNKINVYLEIGAKKIFAGAIDWPGWCRVGRSEADALQALFDLAPRYMQVIECAGMSIPGLKDASSFEVIERLAGNATTDFGAPDVPPSADSQPVNEAELLRLQNLMNACWEAFDLAAQAAVGKDLRLGPRGGGRNLDGIIDHVLGAAESYLGRLAWKLPKSETADLQVRLKQTRTAAQDALELAAHGGVEEQGPRGGKRWTGRYFVRRSAWHILDHALEIEDRILNP
jgi:hypothetical protein